MGLNADVKIGNFFGDNQKDVKQTHKPQGASLAEFDMMMNKTNQQNQLNKMIVDEESKNGNKVETIN